MKDIDLKTIKRTIAVVLSVVMLMMLFAACSTEEPAAPSEETPVADTEETAEEVEPAELDETEVAEEPEDDSEFIYAHVNGAVLKIEPEDNSSADSFINLLDKGDITVDMSDYGSFEKVGALGSELPVSDEKITTECGDVILYQGDQISIYYDTNTWELTRLGKVTDMSQEELKSTLGEGDVSVTFSLSPEPVKEDKSDVLVAYFSYTGNTKAIAGYIAEALGADTYEIKAETPYTKEDTAYNTDCRAKHEQNDPSARPEIAGDIPDLSDYSIIYLGYPIWYGQAPKIIYTFLDGADIGTKTVIPFCTSEASPIGSSADNLHDSAPDADWEDGARFEIGTSKEDIIDWLS